MSILPSTYYIKYVRNNYDLGVQGDLRFYQEVKSQSLTSRKILCSHLAPNYFIILFILCSSYVTHGGKKL